MTIEDFIYIFESSDLGEQDKLKDIMTDCHNYVKENSKESQYMLLPDDFKEKTAKKLKILRGQWSEIVKTVSRC